MLHIGMRTCWITASLTPKILLIPLLQLQREEGERSSRSWTACEGKLQNLTRNSTAHLQQIHVDSSENIISYYSVTAPTNSTVHQSSRNVKEAHQTPGLLNIVCICVYLHAGVSSCLATDMKVSEDRQLLPEPMLGGVSKSRTVADRDGARIHLCDEGVVDSN